MSFDESNKYRIDKIQISGRVRLKFRLKQVHMPFGFIRDSSRRLGHRVIASSRISANSTNSDLRQSSPSASCSRPASRTASSSPRPSSSHIATWSSASSSNIASSSSRSEGGAASACAGVGSTASGALCVGVVSVPDARACCSNGGAVALEYA